jgi:hypothetical protein
MGVASCRARFRAPAVVPSCRTALSGASRLKAHERGLAWPHPEARQVDRARGAVGVAREQQRAGSAQLGGLLQRRRAGAGPGRDRAGDAGGCRVPARSQAYGGVAIGRLDELRPISLRRRWARRKEA